MILIIGAGISGLTLAHHLKKEFIIFEKENQAGGLASQYFSDGYYFDYGGHYFHFQDRPQIKAYLTKYHQLNKFERNSAVYLFDSFIPFPVQYHLSYFPSPLKEKALNELLQNKTINKNNLFEYLKSVFGQTLFNSFFFPFLNKYYQRNLKDLAAGFDKGSIPIPQREDIKQGYGGKVFQKTGYNPFFYYPKGEMRSFFKHYSAGITKKIHFNVKVTKIDVYKKILYTAKKSYPYTTLVNTMPLPLLLNSIIQKDLCQFQDQLSSISTLVVNYVLKKKRRSFHWVYLPQKNTIFYRAGYYPTKDHIKGYLEKNCLNPPNEDIIPSAIRTLQELGMIKDPSEILAINSRIIPISYILFNHHWKYTIPRLFKEFKPYNIFSIGRYGSWRYSCMSEDIELALKTADIINQNEGKN